MCTHVHKHKHTYIHIHGIICKYLWLESCLFHHQKSSIMWSRADVMSMDISRNSASSLSALASFISWHIASGFKMDVVTPDTMFLLKTLRT